MKKLFVLLTVCQLCMLAAIEIVPVGKKYLYKVGEEVVFKVQLNKGRENARFNVRISGILRNNRCNSRRFFVCDGNQSDKS